MFEFSEAYVSPFLFRNQRQRPACFSHNRSLPPGHTCYRLFLFCLCDCKCIVDCLYISIICDLISIYREGILCQSNNRIARQPVLASRRNVILLLCDQLIKFRTTRRVCSQVQDTLRVGYAVAFHILDGIAEVILLECIKRCCSLLVTFLRI